ncbi:MAG TPA: hypothetical protein VD859_08770 [Nocardioides sp.]|nr:hypothetical protein [Nocardioides sp.]
MRSPLERTGVAVVIAAVVPYVTLKVLWLAGSTIGVSDEAALTELHSTRMVVGNNVTIVLDVLAVGLALGLTSDWGRRVPAWIMLGLGAGATGLLAPILLGLPLGTVVQLAVRGSVRTAGMDHLSPWVFATVYGGFALMAVGISVLAWRYAARRWDEVLRHAPEPPSAWVVVLGALGLLPFGAALLWWGVFGPGTSGPQAMDAVSQRTTLVVTGLLAVGGFVTPLVRGMASSVPRLAWLLTWVGCTTAALQAPTLVLLANGGHPSRAIVLMGLLTIPGSSAYGLMVLQRRLTRESRDGQGATVRGRGGAHLLPDVSSHR